MSISIGISHLVVPNPPAGTILQSCCSSFSTQRWKGKTFISFNLRVRPNSGGRSSRQVHQAETGEGIFPTKGLSAEYGADGGEFSEEEFPHDVQVYQAETGEGISTKRGLSAEYGADGEFSEKKFDRIVQVHQAESGEGVFARTDLSAEDGANGREFSEENFVNPVPVGYSGGGGLRAAPKRSNGRSWRRFPDSQQGGSQDVRVPIEALRRGAVFRGTVSSIQAMGAFVNFGAFAEGFVHVSKMSKDYVNSVSDVVELGQEVTVRILKVEELTGRISLSLMDKDEIDRRKPYLSPRLEEARQNGERLHFLSGSGWSALTLGEREERVSKRSSASSSKSVDSREFPRGSGQISPSYAHEEQQRFSSIPKASFRHQEGGGGRRERPRSQPGSGQRYPFGVEEKKIEWNPFASTGLGERQGDRVSKDPFASPREGQYRGEDRQSRNPFASTRPGDAGEADRVSKNPFASSREGHFRGEERQTRNPFASPREGQFRGEERQSRNPFASPREGPLRGEDRESRNPFASSRQWEAREEDRTSRNSSVSFVRREGGEEGSSNRFQHQGNEGNFGTRRRITRGGSGADREGQTKPKMKLVQIQSDVNSEEDKLNAGKVVLHPTALLRVCWRYVMQASTRSSELKIDGRNDGKSQTVAYMSWYHLPLSSVDILLLLLKDPMKSRSYWPRFRLQETTSGILTLNII
ncbi:unnamed protein product [Calypogeia fissa]